MIFFMSSVLLDFDASVSIVSGRDLFSALVICDIEYIGVSAMRQNFEPMLNSSMVYFYLLNSLEKISHFHNKSVLR